MLQFVIRLFMHVALALGTTLAALEFKANAEDFAAVSSSRWQSGNSVVRLLASGSARVFFYETVGSDEDAAGAAARYVLFEGRRSGSDYEGLAYIYSATCGMLTYRASGPVSVDQTQVTISGTAPVLDEACNVVGSKEYSRSFVFFEKIAVDQSEYTVWEDYNSHIHLADSDMFNLILQVGEERVITGELLDRDGDHVAQVTGSNSEPRTIVLDFRSTGGGPSRSGTYRYLADSLDSTLETTLDAGNLPRFRARWQKISGDEGLPDSFEPCAVECGIWQYGHRFEQPDSGLDWKGERFTSPVGGTLCVETTEERLDELAQSLAVARVPEENYCGESQWTDEGTIREGLLTLEVPLGLERWALERLSAADGVKSADYAHGPSGGSGLAAISIGEGVLLPTDLPADLSREYIEARWRESACKIQTIFQSSFRNVEVDHCRNDDGTADDGFCFSVILEGHTSDPQGFASANLAPNIDDKFFVRSKVLFDVSQVKSAKSPSGFLERLRYYVVESKFARQPASDPAASAVFRDIEHFQLGRSDGDVDEQIFGIAQQLVMASTFQCGSK